MRLVIVAPFPPNEHGEGHYSAQFARALAAEFTDVQIQVLAHGVTAAPCPEQLTENLQVLRPMRPSGRLHRHLGCAYLFRAISKFRPDVVHFGGGLLPYFGGRFGEPLLLLSRALSSSGCRQVASFHSTWLLADLASLARAKRLGPLGAAAVKRYYSFLVRSWCRTLDTLSIVTAGEESEIAEQFITEHRLPKHKVLLEPHPCTWPPASAESSMEAKRRLGLEGRRLVLAFGFVRPDKGYHVLLEAAPEIVRSFPNAVVLVAGDPRGGSDNYLHQLRALRDRTCAPDLVRLALRYVPDQELSLYLDAADVLAVPYLRSVGPSGPIHHALGRGKAIVASDLGHNRSLRDRCLLVPPGDARALGAAICHLLRDERKRQCLATKGLDYAAAHSWEHLARAFHGHYRALLDGTKHARTGGPRLLCDLRSASGS